MDPVALGIAYAATVAIEGAVLWFALDRAHPPRTRIAAAFWLSACTLPVVHLTFPLLMHVGWPRVAWLAAAEVFAPAAECALFAWLAPRLAAGVRARPRDFAAIIVANLTSFGAGEAWYALLR